jgi:deoxyribonuclease IV
MPRSAEKGPSTRQTADDPPADRSMAGKYDVLRLPAPATPPSLTRLKIGIHTSTSGGVETAAERAYRLGCNAVQIFSSSPRMWMPFKISPAQADAMRALRAKYQIAPLAIHTSYLVNLCSATPEFLRKSIIAFRGEVERGLALGAEFLVLHPGSFRGKTREEGLACAAESIAASVEGYDLDAGKLRILIENTAGAEFSLGGSFEQVAELLERLRRAVPVGACIDTCHTHVSGYDIVSTEGYAATMGKLDATVGLKNVYLWHCNDAKAACGSKLDRHQHIGEGTIGLEPFRWLLNDPRTQHAAFIAETPIDAPGDDQRNVNTLKNLVD